MLNIFKFPWFTLSHTLCMVKGPNLTYHCKSLVSINMCICSLFESHSVAFHHAVMGFFAMEKCFELAVPEIWLQTCVGMKQPEITSVCCCCPNSTIWRPFSQESHAWSTASHAWSTASPCNIKVRCSFTCTHPEGRPEMSNVPPVWNLRVVIWFPFCVSSRFSS